MNMHHSELSKQHQRYVDVRKKLWGAGLQAPAVSTVKTIKYRPEPLWKIAHINFDDHINLWHEVVRSVMHEAALSMMTEDAPVRRYAAIRQSSRQIIAEVLDVYPDVSFADLRRKTRKQCVVLPRQVAMYEIKTRRPDMSLPAIARLFGGLDHTTVLHAVRKIAALREQVGTPDGEIYAP